METQKPIYDGVTGKPWQPPRVCFCGKPATRGETCGWHTPEAFQRYAANAFPKSVRREQ